MTEPDRPAATTVEGRAAPDRPDPEVSVVDDDPRGEVSTTEPTVADPAVTDPAVTESAVTESAVTGPAVTVAAATTDADTHVDTAPAVDTGPARPAGDAVDTGDAAGTGDAAATTPVWSVVVAGGGYAGRVVAAGTTVRLRDVDGDACAHLVIHRAGAPWERLNVFDTMKVEQPPRLAPGRLLLSDQGRVLATVVADTSGRHDHRCGTSTRATNVERYGTGAVGGPSPAGQELLLLAAARHGLDLRDLPASLALFKGVDVEAASGRLVWLGSAGPAVLELRAEMDIVVLVANTAHRIDPRPVWSCTPLEITAWAGRPTPADDGFVTRTPETARAFAATFADLAARGLR